MTLHHILFQSSSKNASILSKTVWSLISTGIIAIAVYQFIEGYIGNGIFLILSINFN